MANAISVRDGVKAGYGFLPTAWNAGVAALFLQAVAAHAYIYAVFMKLPGPAILGALVVLALADAVAVGGLLRLALAGPRRGHGLGPGGLQWGWIESRLVGLALLLTLLFALVSLLLVIALVMVSIAVSLPASPPASPGVSAWFASVGPIGAGVFVLAAAACAAVLVWLGVRLSLAQPATVARGRIQLLSSITLTRTGFWTVFGVVLATAAPLLVVLGLAVVLRPSGDVVSMPLAMGLAALAGLTLAFVHTPAKVGGLAYLYRAIAPAETV